MSTESKPSIVFCHGIWADGSSFRKVIPTLQAEGHQVIAAQYGLDTPEEDVATVIRTLNRVEAPAIPRRPLLRRVRYHRSGHRRPCRWAGLHRRAGP